MRISRRGFLRQSGGVAAGFVGLQRLLDGPLVAAAAPTVQAYQSEVEAYGKLVRDPKRILDLPKGFEYTVVSVMGDPMSDGFRTPGAPDGMAAFPLDDDRVVVVRNHELEDDVTLMGPFGLENQLVSRVPEDKLYDAGKGVQPQLGGTSTFVYDVQRRKVKSHFLSLAGTVRNCAGGLTPWGSWISCEETLQLEDEFRERHHGYNFEVPASDKMGLVVPVPLKAMGRFNHEAVAVDPATGIVYQTEDEHNGLITRFIPNEPGKLQVGGRLEALVVRGNAACDTRNWPDVGAPAIPIGEMLEVSWMPIEDTENLDGKLRLNSFRAGAAIFARGEGMWYGSGKIYFACTSGGRAKSGQVFVYSPSPHEGTVLEDRSPGRLTLYLEPNNTNLLEFGDNLTVAPWGDVILCEDGAKDQYLRGITSAGKIYTLARSGYHGNSEMCGVCFAPNHPTLFVNIQVPGITLAITGPWGEGCGGI
ncbi:MAG: hypothetical protein M2R45_01239 [Verrucomicrobia subdivision 3 bacterium]|nr:hypothetical protein [Limisphaerales bacterium]MCS1415110.1 hypothetical protein [Limisphaerales bacterium]